MRFNICSNINNGVGLESDYKLLKGRLEGWGHSVNGVHYMRIDAGIPRADVNIFLETMASALFPMAREQWLIPNQEWWAPWDHENTMHHVDKILCKTHDAVRIFSEMYGAARCRHIGFESRDLYDPAIERKRQFFHMAGQSRYKNSSAVAYAFAKYFDDPSDKDVHKELYFVGAYREEIQFAEGHKNLHYIQRAGDSELKKLMNESLFHIIPSGAEGWGHAIHEGLGCGAIVITTNYPPMSEFDGTVKELLVPYQRTAPELCAQRAFVGAMEVKAVIEKAWKLTPDKIAQYQVEARAAFLAQREYFRTEFKKVVDGK